MDSPSMNPTPARLVVVDPRLDDYRCLSELTQTNRLRLTATTNGATALRLAPSFADSVWVVCPELPDMNGLDLLEMLVSLQPRLHVVMLDNHYDPQRELRALHSRAVQYACKPLRPEWLASWRPPISAPTQAPVHAPHFGARVTSPSH